MGPTALLPLRRKAYWGFFRPKNPTASTGFEPANKVLNASTQPLDHRSHKTEVPGEKLVTAPVWPPGSNPGIRKVQLPEQIDIHLNYIYIYMCVCVCVCIYSLETLQRTHCTFLTKTSPMNSQITDGYCESQKQHNLAAKYRISQCRSRWYI